MALCCGLVWVSIITTGQFQAAPEAPGIFTLIPSECDISAPQQPIRGQYASWWPMRGQHCRVPLPGAWLVTRAQSVPATGVRSSEQSGHWGLQRVSYPCCRLLSFKPILKFFLNLILYISLDGEWWCSVLNEYYFRQKWLGSHGVNIIHFSQLTLLTS